MPAITCAKRWGWVLGVLLMFMPIGWDAAADAAARGASTATTQPAPATRRAPAVKEVRLTTQAAAREAAAAIAELRIAGEITDSPPDFSLLSFSESSTTLRDWLHRLATVRQDDRVAVVALEIGGADMTWAHAQELAEAIRRLDAAKPVHTFMVQGGTLSYLLASAGREVTIDPSGQIMMSGLAAELTFFRGTLDLLGIEPQFIQVGRYKGASEPMASTQPSKEFRGEYNKILDDLYDQLCGQIARQRKLKPAAVRAAIDAGPFSASSARKHELVDRLQTVRQWKAGLENGLASKGKTVQWLADYGHKPRETIDLTSPLAVLGLLARGRSEQKIHDPTIAIIHVDGMIVDGQSGDSLFGGKLAGARTLSKCFNDAANDDRIKAVVFRIDSPGGSAVGSELIYQAVRNCATKKPVIASIGQTGASGGYYVAVGAKTILADPCGLTGSIGVVSGKLALKGLMNKIGVTTYEITRGRNAGLWLSRPWKPHEEAVIRKMAEETYDTFTRRVKESRGKRIRDIDAVAQGRIFTAQQALANGLIDRLGGLSDAANLAKKEAKIEACEYLTLPRPKTLMDMLSGGGFGASMPAGGQAEMLLLGRLAARSAALAYVLQLCEMMDREVVLTAMPFHLAVRP